MVHWNVDARRADVWRNITMARPGKREQSFDFVEASLNYRRHRRKASKPVKRARHDPVQHTGKYADRPATIHNSGLFAIVSRSSARASY